MSEFTKQKLYSRVLIILGILVVTLTIFILVFVSDIDEEFKRIFLSYGDVSYNTLSHNNIDTYRYDFINVITTSRECLEGVALKDEIYIISNGGLLKFNKNFIKQKLYTINNGLLSHNLSAICVYKNRIFIGTGDKGITVLKENNLTNFVFDEAGHNRISCLYTGNEQLFIGGKFSGLILFDGSEFRNEFRGLFEDVTSLIQTPDGQLVIGTELGNIFFMSDKRVDKELGNDDGLPGGSINGLVYKDDVLFIATNYGIYSIDRDFNIEPRFKGFFTKGFVRFQNILYAYTYSGDIINLKEKTKNEINEPINGAFSDDNNCYFCTDNGIYTFGKQVYEPKNEIPGNYITSIDFDAKGCILGGTFENGLFILGKNFKTVLNFYSDFIRQVNHVMYDKNTGLTYVSTTDGIAIYQEDKMKNFLNEEDGLISNYVSYTYKINNRIYAATGSGLSILEKGVIKNLYAFHGLVNNHTYTIAELNAKIYIGTLGGISAMEHDRIIVSYTIANTDLTSNWITALLKVNEELWIGTYGKGIFKMDKSGVVSHIDIGDNTFEVNNNAMYFDGRKIFIGTLDKGLLLLDPGLNVSTVFNQYLPSNNVTSINGDNSNIIIGTDKGLVIINKDNFKF